VAARRACFTSSCFRLASSTSSCYNKTHKLKICNTNWNKYDHS
jgi:hypothetical protein